MPREVKVRYRDGCALAYNLTCTHACTHLTHAAVPTHTAAQVRMYAQGVLWALGNVFLNAAEHVQPAGAAMT